MLLILVLSVFCAHYVFSLDTMKTKTQSIHEFQLNNSAGVMEALNMLPKDCKKNGQTYKAGETFEIGNLRYKCQEYGVYTFEGCKRKDGHEMALGQSEVVDNIKYQCLSMGSSVFYKETTCGIMGQPECDKIPLPKGFEEAQKKKSENKEKEAKVDGLHLPKGWSLMDGGTKPITGTNASVVTQILTFNPVPSRVKRDGFAGRGIGSVVGVETVDGDQIGKPLSSKSKVLGTQTVGAHLGMIKEGDKHDRDLVDLNQRKDVKVGDKGLKRESVKGSKSSVDWAGRKVVVNGKTVGAGEGTFSFGNKPTH